MPTTLVVPTSYRPTLDRLGQAVRTEALAREFGVLTRQGAAQAYGKSRVRAQLAAHRWQAPTPRVVILHNGPPTGEQKVWAALLSGPPGTLLHGLSGARYDGLRGLTADRLTLLLPGSSRNCVGRLRRIIDEWQVAVRWSTVLGRIDVHPLAVPPRTRLPQSLVDAAAERVPPRRARVIILAGVQQRLVRAPAMSDALSRRGHCRNRAVIVEAIIDASGGIQSLPEADFNNIRTRYHLPEPRRQQVLQRPDGRYYLDNDWPEFGVRAEIHGIPHFEVANWDNDLRRQNDISIEGVACFSSRLLRLGTCKRRLATSWFECRADAGGRANGRANGRGGSGAEAAPTTPPSDLVS